MFAENRERGLSAASTRTMGSTREISFGVSVGISVRYG